VLLPDHVVDRARPEPGRERRGRDRSRSSAAAVNRSATEHLPYGVRRNSTTRSISSWTSIHIQAENSVPSGVGVIGSRIGSKKNQRWT
jgi:hypothetical protein